MLGDVIGHGVERSENSLAFCGIVEADAVVFLHEHDEFQGVDGIQAETFAEEGLAVDDVFGCDFFEREDFDDLLLELAFEFVHSGKEMRG